ncbi:DNA topoisomerase 2 [Massospora cicadina]|nr:DNA topoisomerase 2 [Massospora cicadina]
MPQPKKQKAVTNAIPKKAANSKAPIKLRKAAVPRTNSITTNEVKQAESDVDSDYKALMVPEEGVPTLAPIFNATSHKMGKKKTVEEIYQKKMQLEHILLRPDTYIGSTKMNSQHGILVEIHKEEKVYIPKLLFCHLLTSSNYDNRGKVCNIFSNEFIVETASKELGKKYYQKFTNNMSVIGPPKITNLGKGEFMRITFQPDLSNNLKVNNFKDYIQMYLKSAPGPNREDLTKRIVFILSSSGQLQQVNLGNSISTSKGGLHVNYMVDAIMKLIQEALDKKKLKSKILPGVIKGNMWIFVNCLIDNPSFDTQTKENDFEACQLLFMLQDYKKVPGRAKDNMAMLEALDSTKCGFISGIPKLEDANKVGTQESDKCTLILTEGDSAKALVMVGLTKVGWDYYTMFSLCGKLLDMQDASSAQVKGNKELINICKIMGLNCKVNN